ncbi:flagellar hook assembly protein FlgD [Bacillus marinisedimentorum]|uniref:flagellar hook assembly protein FlgD n=1 Tax=Bacillus marinisedimentorum TaxID=1821260 RepID=UPI0007DFB611|nr:flagellar hook assembly protein FlgD [Bacillus marinisedimentorum]
MGNTIDPGYYLSSVKPEERQTGQTNLGKDAFLKLLLTQLQNQDPMQPMQDKEFISQMATFSSLEQMANMNSKLEAFLVGQSKNAIASYSEMIGKEVEFNYLDSSSEKYVSGKGEVDSVLLKNGSYYLQLTGGEQINPADVVRVSRPGSPV